MFIKKDLRKIPRILADATPVNAEHSNNDENASKRIKREVLRELPLARRKAEFKGSLSILCQPSSAPSLQNLVSLSVYDCDIQSLDGIGFLGSIVDGGRGVCCPALASLNVGRNPITTLPDELSMLSRSLKELWCDDCRIRDALPSCVLSLDNLEILHLPNNHITEIPREISNLQKLKHLCLDNNQIKALPKDLALLDKLEVLLLRQNLISHLPDLPARLRLLHVSSNLLERLPSSLDKCTQLQYLFANSNRLKSIPRCIEACESLQKLNLSNNLLEQIERSFIARFGEPDTTTGVCKDTNGCVTYVGRNPFLIHSSMSPDHASVQPVLVGKNV